MELSIIEYEATEKLSGRSNSFFKEGLTYLFQLPIKYHNFKDGKGVIAFDCVVRHIEDDFYACGNLISITLPESIVSISNDSFSGCYNLTSIFIPKNVRRIGKNAFADCSRLTSICVDEENKTYDSRGNCNAIIETASNTLVAGCLNSVIPDSVVKIGDYAFSGRNLLESIEIGDNIVSIGERAFASCRDLKDFKIGDSVTSIGSCALIACRLLATLSIGKSLSSVGNYAFDSNDMLKTVICRSSDASIIRSFHPSYPLKFYVNGKLMDAFRSENDNPKLIEVHSVDDLPHQE